MHLGKHFNILEELLEDFHYFHKKIIKEYNMDCFTKKLSKDDLLTIAKMLPNINEWQDDKFKIIKDEIKTTYNIGSKELSTAIDIIKRHYEFWNSSLINKF